MNATRSTPRTAALAALALATSATLALAGCSAPADSGGDTGQLRVVATTTQLADFAKEVGGDDVTVTGLLVAGASAHGFDPTPADLVELGRADVLIVNGAGLETFVDSAVESSGFAGVTIVAADGVDLEEASDITAEALASDAHADDAHDEGAAAPATDDHTGTADDHDHDGDGVQDHTAEEHDAATTETATADEHADEPASATDDHAGHDHGDVNPHLWTSPRYAADMVSEIARGLAEADPANAAAYTERADAYTERLTALDAWVAAQFARVPDADRVLVSGHDGLRYFLYDYNIEFAGSILPSFEDNAEPSAAQVDALVANIKERGVKAIFVESSMNPKLADTIAAEAGITVADAGSLYADSLGVAGSGAETYIGSVIANTTLILEAWGVTPDAVPSTVQ